MFPQFFIELSAIVEFCIVMQVLSIAFNFVLLKLISVTVPENSPISTQSPILNGLSIKIANPPNIFFAKSCAAKAITTLEIPRPVTRPPKL